MHTLRSKRLIVAATFTALIASAIIVRAATEFWTRRTAYHPIAQTQNAAVTPAPNLSPFQRDVLAELDREVRAGIQYQDGYYKGGDPPPNIGVCSDVIIRSFRAAGVDLKTAVTKDVQAARRVYGIGRPDPNIDHRRCRNLAVYFKRHAVALPLSRPNADWQPGDIVLWSTRGNSYIDHVGMVAARRDLSGNHTIIHHWPGLPVTETDGLYRFKVMGHYRWPSLTRS